MIKISELKEGDTLKAGSATITILHNLGKVVIAEDASGETFTFSEKELNLNDYRLDVPAPEPKTYMGFEVREYPERPIVEVCDRDGDLTRVLRRLIRVEKNQVICENATDKSPFPWQYIYRIPETRIVEPTSQVTRDGDGC